jgi:hypothetical protein
MKSAKTTMKSSTKSIQPSKEQKEQKEGKKRGRPPKPKVNPNDTTLAVMMVLGKTDDMTFVRTGCGALVDLGIENPVEKWTQGNYSQAADLIKKELGLPELKNDYVRISNSLQSLGHAHKLVTTLADTLIQISTMTSFFKTLN